MRKIFIYCIIIHLLIPVFVYANSTDTKGQVCNQTNSKDTYLRLCNSVDDILCSKIPDRLRRSCEERDKSIIHPEMTREEVGNFAVGCFKSAVTSIEKFFTEFLPELCKSIWDISKKLYAASSNDTVWNSVKGAYESAKSLSSDVYEAAFKNPSKFFSNIWNQITDAVFPMISNYDCLKPQVKIEKVCAVATALLFPPFKMALLLVKGAKSLKGLAIKKLDEVAKGSSTAELSRAEFKLLFSRYRELGYSIEDLKLIKANNKLRTIDYNKLKSLTTDEDQGQYLKLTGQRLFEPAEIELKDSSVRSKYKLKRALKIDRKNPKYNTSIDFKDDQKLILSAYKDRYSKQVAITDDQSAQFIEKMKMDNLNPNAKVLYFDVENSLQKKLNDDVFGEKDAVNSLNNSFFSKFYSEISSNIELMKYIDGEYKDYKSLKFRLKYSSEEERLKLEGMLAEAYKKTNDEFIKDLKDSSINKLLPVSTNALSNIDTWFLAGSGKDALEANMAARAARKANAPPGTLSLYRTHTEALHRELGQIRNLQLNLASRPNLSNSGVLDNLEGNITLSKSMINILRKTKRNEYKSDELYMDKIRSTVRKKLGTHLDDETISELSEYFEKVDSISPPIFTGKRVLINLANAEHGIISVDFAGVGADNIYNQMKKLAEVNITKSQHDLALKESFQKMQTGIDKVSDEMGSSRNLFSTSVSSIDGSDIRSHLFTGDDGIHMPQVRSWNDENKIKLVQQLTETGHASKYRVTFVSTHFSDGKKIPANDRSLAVVRAETVEKDLRSKMISMNKINESEASKIITAIDYGPQEKGGVFNLIVGGKDFTDDEKKIIEKSFSSVLSKKDGEIVGKIIFSEVIP